jgi:hypothetical protein
MLTAATQRTLRFSGRPCVKTIAISRVFHLSRGDLFLTQIYRAKKDTRVPTTSGRLYSLACGCAGRFEIPGELKSARHRFLDRGAQKRLNFRTTVDHRSGCLRKKKGHDTCNAFLAARWLCKHRPRAAEGRPLAAGALETWILLCRRPGGAKACARAIDSRLATLETDGRGLIRAARSGFQVVKRF